MGVLSQSSLLPNTSLSEELGKATPCPSAERVGVSSQESLIAALFSLSKLSSNGGTHSHLQRETASFLTHYLSLVP